MIMILSIPNSNPTNRVITPRNDQDWKQQQSDQNDCYDQTCEMLDWDPYQAYDVMVEKGYTVALDPEEMEHGLICLVAQGVIAGSIAGEVVGDSESGAAVGAAIGAASGLIQSAYLNDPDDPVAQKEVSRFERDLRKWETKFTSCMKRNGYRVHSD